MDGPLAGEVPRRALSRGRRQAYQEQGAKRPGWMQVKFKINMIPLIHTEHGKKSCLYTVTGTQNS